MKTCHLKTSRGGTEAVERLIAERTWGCIQRLRVELCDGCVVIHGSAPSYHAKQLVLAAVRELFDSVTVNLDIRVLENAPHSSSASDLLGEGEAGGSGVDLP